MAYKRPAEWLVKISLTPTASPDKRAKPSSFTRRDQNGAITDPGNDSPIPGGIRTSRFGARDRAHPDGHQGNDWINPPGNPGGPAGPGRPGGAGGSERMDRRK